MISTLRWMVLAAVVLSTSGCLRGLFGTQAPLEQYRIVVPASPNDGVPAIGAAPLTGALAILPYETRGIYDRRSIAFRTDDYRLQAYPSREWAIPLRDMLGEATEAVLRRTPISTEPAVFDQRARSSQTYLWRGNVIEFEEVNRGQQVLAAVHLEVEIIRAANDSVVWRGSERIERPVPEPTNSMDRVVETLSALTADAITALASRARAALTLPAAATAPPPA